MAEKTMTKQSCENCYFKCHNSWGQSYCLECDNESMGKAEHDRVIEARLNNGHDCPYWQSDIY